MKKVALFGYNAMSHEALTRIDRNRYELVVIDHDPEHIELANQNGFETARLDFRSDDDLKHVGIGDSIDTLFCFFEEDSQNVFLTLSARALDANLTIIAIVYSPESSEKLRAAGADKLIDPYEICARKIHDRLKRPDISDLFDHAVFGRHDLNLTEVLIPETSSWVGRSLGELSLTRQYNLILIGIVNPEMSNALSFMMEENARRLVAGDILVILGAEDEMTAFRKDVER
jgi:voltage-gated potassium channel